MANKKNIIDDLIDSFAPSIFGNKQIKKGILAQLFGGSNK
jgi:DNA replicative helicase MCM subunit Mcm2 (Cdc46/Mcm family)